MGGAGGNNNNNAIGDNAVGQGSRTPTVPAVHDKYSDLQAYINGLATDPAADKVIIRVGDDRYMNDNNPSLAELMGVKVR